MRGAEWQPILDVVNNAGAVNSAINDSVGNNISNTYQKKTEPIAVATMAMYASDDKSKGTIEERLTNLGFREGAVELPKEFAELAPANNLKRQANYVIGDLSIETTSDLAVRPNDVIGVVPSEFAPKIIQNFVCCKFITGEIESQRYGYIRVEFKIDVDGKIIITNVIYDAYSKLTETQIGYTRIPLSLVAGVKLDLFFAYEANLIV